MASVSMVRYQNALEARNKAVARARQARSGGNPGAVRTALGTLGGTAVAGVADGYLGEGTATYVGIVSGMAGLFLRQPDLINVGSGMLAPAVYRAARDRTEKMKGDMSWAVSGAQTE